ncbi:hypothetical protein ACKP2L_05900 [Oenococcus alcoholitolerans]|uniref:hypothetical protein n=1 Tax=Oenococcus alcoholitolerans TaxID=931074 RepID=UPI003F70ED47
MNPSVKFFLVLFMSLELSLNRSIYANFYVLSISVLLLLLARSSFKKILWLLLMPLIPAFGTGLSFYMHGSGDYLYNTWLYSSRIYALVWLGAYLTFTIDTSELLDSLYQNCHLPAKFTYGFMGAFNFIP